MARTKLTARRTTGPSQVPGMLRLETRRDQIADWEYLKEFYEKLQAEDQIEDEQSGVMATQSYLLAHQLFAV